MAATFTIPSIFTAIDRFSPPMMKMQNTVHGFVSKSTAGLAVVERSYRKLMTPIHNLNQMLMGVGYYVGLYTLIRVVRNAIKTLADFEQMQVDISVVSGRSVKQNEALSSQARMLALTYGDAAKNVSELHLNLVKLGFNENSRLIQMTDPILAASIALKGVPDEVGKTIGAIIQAFKIPETRTNEIADLLAKAADLSALDWSNLQTMLPTAMQSAAIAFKDIQDPVDRLKQLLSMMAMVRNAQVHVSSGATGIKNLLVDAGIYGKTYEDILQKIIESPNALKKAHKLLGRRTLVSALPLAEAQKMGGIEDFFNQLTKESGGYAARVASQRLNSINGLTQILKRSWDELIFSIDDGSGKFAGSLRLILQVSSAMLLLLANTDQARAKLATMNPVIIDMAEKFNSWGAFIFKVTAAFIVLRLAMIAYSAVVVAGRAALFAYNVALGISAALHYTSVRALKGNVVAMTTLRTITLLTTRANRLFSLSMLTSPLGIFALGIGLLIGGFKLMDSWMESTMRKFDTMSSSIGGVSGELDGLTNNFKKFYTNNADLVQNPLFRTMNPEFVKKYEEQEKYINANYSRLRTEGMKQGANRLDSNWSPYDVLEGDQSNYYKNNGVIRLIVDDKSGSVKDVETSGDFNIMPETGSTMGMDQGKSFRQTRK